jgi:hypothetical protein
MKIAGSGLRSLEVAFPRRDSSDAGSNPAEVVEFLRTEKFREQVLRKGLHVEEPQAPRVHLRKIIGHFPSKVSVDALR